MKTGGRQISGQSCSAEMERPQRRDGQKISFMSKFSKPNGSFPYQMFGQGAAGSNRLVLLCLSLLNVALLIVAVVIGIKCAKVSDVSLQVATGLNDLRGNHSDVVKAEEEAREALKSALKHHAQIKEKIKQLMTINGNYQRQMEALQTERNSLLSNMSALEGTCGRCPIGWIHLNSSCYFFSYTESASIRKNWPDSRADCRQRGADLIVIDNPEEQKFVCATIEDMGDHLSFWLGLSDMKEEGKWIWINNVTEVDERYWTNGEPNNQGIGEDCAATYYRPTAPWKIRNDLGCTRHSVYWICEM